jgi:hypothetical protein
MNKNVNVPEKVQNFIAVSESLNLKGEKLAKAFHKSFPEAYYDRPPKIREAQSKGIWIDPGTKLGLIVKNNNDCELF